jgi:hypothetical protein
LIRLIKTDKNRKIVRGSCICNGCGVAVEPVQLLIEAVRKYLPYQYVPIMVKTFRIDNRESCRVQRSIYVILRGKEETRHFIRQVRNVLRHVSDRIVKYMFLFKTRYKISDLIFRFKIFDAH